MIPLVPSFDIPEAITYGIILRACLSGNFDPVSGQPTPQRISDILTQGITKPGEGDAPEAIFACSLIAEKEQPRQNALANALIASSRGDLATVQTFLSNPKSSHDRQELQMVLDAAIIGEHIPIIKFCFSQGAEFSGDCQAGLQGPWTLELFEVLTSHNPVGSGTSSKYMETIILDISRQSPCFPKVAKTPESLAIEESKVKFARAVLSRGGSITDAAVIQAVMNRSLHFVQLFAEYGAMDALLSTRKGALHAACANNRVDIVGWLIEKGADVDGFCWKDFLSNPGERPQKFGYPILYARESASWEVVDLLLDAGASQDTDIYDSRYAWYLRLAHGW